MPHLLYLVAERADGRRTYQQIADEISEAIERGVSGENVEFLAEEKLRPLGILAQADGSTPKLQKVDPLLALKFRAALVPDWVVRSITTVFKPLFLPPVILAVLAGLAVFDFWLFGSHGVAQSTRQLLYQPAWLLATLGLVIISAAFHECGHATACRYGGAKPGVMGAGIYLVWPAFYTDVTDAYRLNKWGRLRTDLGGIYFNCIFILATAGLYFATGWEPLLVVILVQHLEIAHQLLPFVRLDGYYIVSDMTGVPDMFARIKPTLKSLLPWTKADETVTALKPWVRIVVSVYVLALIPILGGMLIFVLMSAPRIFATTWDSMFVQSDKIGDAFSAGNALAGVAGVVQIVALMLPVAGMGAAFSSLGRRIAVTTWQRTEGNPGARAAATVVAAGALGFLGYLWWPNGEYKPIQPGERGTVQGAVEQLSAIPEGRPALTPDRERELGGAPTERSLRDSGITRDDLEQPTGTTTSPTETTSTTTTQPEPGTTAPTPTATAPAGTTAPTSTTPTATTPTETSTTTTTPTSTTPTTPTTTTP